MRANRLQVASAVSMAVALVARGANRSRRPACAAIALSPRRSEPPPCAWPVATRKVSPVRTVEPAPFWFENLASEEPDAHPPVRAAAPVAIAEPEPASVPEPEADVEPPTELETEPEAEVEPEEPAEAEEPAFYDIEVEEPDLLCDEDEQDAEDYPSEDAYDEPEGWDGERAAEEWEEDAEDWDEDPEQREEHPEDREEHPEDREEHPEDREEHPEPEDDKPAWGWIEPWRFDDLLAPAARARRSRQAAAKRRRPRPRGRTKSEPRRRLILRRRRRTLLAVAAAAALTGAIVGSGHSSSANAHTDRTAQQSWMTDLTPPPSAYAERTIPPTYLRLYVKAAGEYGLEWTKLAAVGQIESDQGRSQVAGVADGTNGAGAAGPAQFESATWRRFGVDADGRGGSNPYDPADAITAMAAYLKASGAPDDWRAALFAYNHSAAYVNQVLAVANELSASGVKTA
jgi:Transglycosylase SLT domain